MNRDSVCRKIADEIRRLKEKEKSLAFLPPEVRLLYGTTPGARTPVIYQPASYFSFPAIKRVISTIKCSATIRANICC